MVEPSSQRQAEETPGKQSHAKSSPVKMGRHRLMKHPDFSQSSAAPTIRNNPLFGRLQALLLRELQIREQGSGIHTLVVGFFGD